MGGATSEIFLSTARPGSFTVVDVGGVRSWTVDGRFETAARARERTWSMTAICEGIVICGHEGGVTILDADFAEQSNWSIPEGKPIVEARTVGTRLLLACTDTAQIQTSGGSPLVESFAVPPMISGVGAHGEALMVSNWPGQLFVFDRRCQRAVGVGDGHVHSCDDDGVWVTSLKGPAMGQFALWRQEGAMPGPIAILDCDLATWGPPRAGVHRISQDQRLLVFERGFRVVALETEGFRIVHEEVVPWLVRAGCIVGTSLGLLCGDGELHLVRLP
jgi:hypothetical protein